MRLARVEVIAEKANYERSLTAERTVAATRSRRRRHQRWMPGRELLLRTGPPNQQRVPSSRSRVGGNAIHRASC